MSKLATTLEPSLGSIPTSVVEEITADGHVFASARWFAFLESLKLADVIGGKIELAFAVARLDGEPIAIAPVFRAQGDGVYFIYSLRKFYFEHWIDEAVRMEPQRREHFARLMTIVSGLRRCYELAGAPLEDSLILASPLCYRSYVSVAPSASVERKEVLASVVKTLKAEAKRRRLPLWVPFVEGAASSFAESLADAGFEKSFLFFDNRLDLGGFANLDDYFAVFRRTTRRAFLREIRRTRSADVTFRFVDDLDANADEFTQLYTQTYSRYGESFFRHEPNYWRQLCRHLGVGCEAILAEKEDRLIGFSVLLESRRRGEMWTYRIGRTDEGALADVPYYFWLSFYGPIERALELGYRRIWLGPASYEAKSLRGAVQVPIYSYYWFPRRVDRWLVVPFLKLFGQAAKEEIEKSLVRQNGVQDNAPTTVEKSRRDTT